MAIPWRQTIQVAALAARGTQPIGTVTGPMAVTSGASTPSLRRARAGAPRDRVKLVIEHGANFEFCEVSFWAMDSNEVVTGQV